ncbi:hypothetical protein EBBID32_13800 [Sphingobium indicum BiD32]|uniref:Transporter n=1 Tax=Sphingobium indicum BiD32 TaxID=1301087 RepID=N1MJB3_9SPHN|nr:transporter [Sphingobium indicum]CCW17041.1 hypothetical protein EBBID32_13800 [Sphingobium indicum BiD32]
MTRLWAIAITILAFATSSGPALAQSQPDVPKLRELCPDRPGLGTPACTIDRGHVVVELGMGSWVRDSDAAVRTDSVSSGELLVRVGVTNSLEAQFGWFGYSRTRTRDLQSGSLSEAGGGGDISIALRQNLSNPDGSGTAVAVMPYVTLPIGTSPSGAGDWGIGLLVPMSVELPKGLSISLTPRIDAVVDSDGRGRHLAFGTTAGFGFEIINKLSATVELSMARDCEPAGHSTIGLAGLSFGWQPTDALQLDAGLNIGLNHDSPDREVYVGITQRF